MKINSQPYILLFFFFILFLQCQKDLDKLPDNIQIEVDIININQAEISAEVRNPGDFDILNVGFLYAKDTFNCNAPVNEIMGSYDEGTNMISAPNNITQLALDSNFFFRAFVELINPNTGKQEKICSPTFKDKTGVLRLNAGFKIIDKAVELNFSIDGLQGAAKVSEYGHFWVKSTERKEKEAVVLNFEDAEDDTKTSFLALERDTSFLYSLEEPFETATYYYVKSYAKFEDKVVVSNEVLEIFIGDVWKKIATFPNSDDACRYLAVSFAMKGADPLNPEKEFGYVGLGWWFEGCDYNNRNELKKDFWRYDPEADFWERVADFPGEPRCSSTAFVIEDRAFVGLGNQVGIRTEFKDFYEYHPAEDKWTRKEDFPQPITSAVSFSIPETGKAYVGTGRVCIKEDCDCSVKQCYLRAFYEFDPDYINEMADNVDELEKSKGKWTIKASLPEKDEQDNSYLARISSVGFAIDGYGYISTGLGVNNFRPDLWRYNPNAVDEAGNMVGTWDRMKDIPVIPRELGIGLALGKQGYVGIGGQFNRPAATDFWQYDPLKDDWTRLAAVGTPEETFRRQASVSFVIKDTAYVGTGDILTTDNRNIVSKQFFKYVPNLQNGQ